MAVEKFGFELQSNLDKIKKDLKAVDDDIVKLQRRKVELQWKADKLKNYQKMIQDIDVDIKKIQARKLEIKSDSSDIKKVKEEIHQVDVEIKELQARKLEIKAESSEVKKVNDDIQKIDIEIKKVQAKKLEIKADPSKVKDATKELQNLDKNLLTLRSKKANLQVETKKLKAAQTDLTSIDKKLDKLRSKKANLQVESKKLKGAQTELNDLNKKLDTLRAKKATFQVETQKLKGAQTELNTLNRDLNKLSNQRNKLNVNYENLEKANTLTDSLRTKLNTLSTDLKNFGQGMGTVGTTMTKFFTLPIMATGAGAMKASIDWESDFASVKKTNDEIIDSNGEVAYSYEQLEEDLRGLTKVLPSTHSEIAGVAEQGGQLGIATDKVSGFTKTILDLAESTNLTAEMGAETLARFMNIMGTEPEMLSNIGSALVYLGNNYATTEADITSMMMRLAGSGKQIGLAESDVLAISTALTSVGINAEAGGTAFSKLFSKMAMASSQGFDKVQEVMDATGMSLRELEMLADIDPKGFKALSQDMGMLSTEVRDLIKAGNDLEGFSEVAGVSTSEFKKMFEEDAVSAIALFVEGLGDAENRGTTAIAMLEEMGISEVRLRDALLRSGGAQELLNNAISDSSNAYKENTALTEEAQKRYETTESKLKMLKSEVRETAIELGGPLVDAMKDVWEWSRPMIEGIKDALQWFADADEGTQKWILGIAGGLAAAGPSFKLIGGFTTGLGKFFGVLSKLKKLPSLGNVLPGGKAAGGVVGSGAEAIGSFGNAFKNVGLSAAKNAKNLGTVWAVIQLVKDAAEAIKQIDEKVPHDLGSMQPKLVLMAETITGMGLITAAAGKLMTEKEALTGVGFVLGLTVELMLLAEAMQQIDEKVTTDFSGMQTKLGLMAEAIAGMGLITGGIGMLLSKNPQGIEAAITGVTAVVALTLELMLLAEAMKQIDDKVPGDLGLMQAKMANMGLAIGEMAVITGLIGTALLGSGGILAILEIAGVAAVTTFAGELMLLAEAMQQLDEKVPSDHARVEKKIKSIESVLGAIQDLNIGGFWASLKNMFKGFNINTLTSNAKKLAEAAVALNTIGEAELDATATETNLGAIESFLKAIDKIKIGGFWASVMNFFKGFNIDALTENVKKLADAAVALDTVGDAELDAKAIETNLTNISGFLATIAGMGDLEKDGKAASDNLVNAHAALVKINEMTGEIEKLLAFNGLEGEMQEVTGEAWAQGEKIEMKTSKLDEFYKKIQELDLAVRQVLSYDFGPVNYDSDAVTRITEAKTRLEELNTLATEVTNILAFDALDGPGKEKKTLKVDIPTVSKDGLHQTSMESKEIEVQVSRLDEFSDRLGVLDEALQRIFEYKFSSEKNATELKTQLSNANTRLAELKTLTENLATVLDYKGLEGFVEVADIDGKKTKETKLDNFKKTLERLDEAVTEIMTFKFSTDMEPAAEVIADGYNLAGGDGNGPAIVQTVEDGITKATSRLSLIDGILEALKTFQEKKPVDQTKLSKVMGSIKQGFTGIQTVLNDTPLPEEEKVEALQGIIDLVNNALESLSGLAEKFNPIGNSYGKKLIEGFVASDVAKGLSDNIDGTRKTLEKQYAKFKTLGKKYGEKVVEGFSLSEMAKIVSDKAKELATARTSFGQLGTNLGVALRDSFRNALKGMTNGLKTEIDEVQRKIDELDVPKTDSSGSSSSTTPPSTARPIPLAAGGPVPQYLADGGQVGQSIFKPIGRDTQPVMAEPGEFMQPKRAADFWGADFMESVRQLDLEGAYRSMSSMMSRQISQVVNNTSYVSTVNHSQVDNSTTVQHIKQASPAYAIRLARRRG